MIYIESLMLTVVLFILCVATLTDFKRGVIPNRLLLWGLIIECSLDIVYYLFFYQTGFLNFISNALFISFLAILFYALEIWAAGDSKLLIVVAMGIPSRLYSFIPLNYCPLFILVISVFSLAFVYSTGETIVRSVKEERHFWKEFGFYFSCQKVVSFVLTMLFMISSVLLCNIALGLWLRNQEGNSTLLILAVDFVITLLLIEIRKKINVKALMVFSLLLLIAVLLFLFLGTIRLSFGSGGVLSIVVVLFTIITKTLSGKYNYQEIPLENLSAGMILASVYAIRINMTSFSNDPLPITEGRKARLTAEQVERIKRLPNNGDSSVFIVRKIPFAIFILLGTILFLGAEASFLWLT